MIDIPISTVMIERGMTSAPLGHIVLCMKNQVDCEISNMLYGLVEFTPQIWTQLIRVNGQFNTKIHSMTDWDRTGKLDVWSVSGNVGDCEDYALQKRKELIHLGWPSHSTLIAIVIDPQFGSHAVLVVRTSKGDFVLDNLYKTVMAWYKTPYRWIKRQSTTDPRKWVRLNKSKVKS